jgi:CRP/FNR family cyclic AMP-dependent transcriptional regulator
MARTLPPPVVDSLARSNWDRPTAGDRARVLSGLPLFAGVSERQLTKIAQLAHVAEHKTGEVLIREGEPGDAFYVILAGRARVLGRPRARLLKTGDYFGEMSLIDGAPRSATIAAAEELQTMRLPEEPFRELLAQEPSLMLAMLRELADRVRRLQKTPD